MLQPSNFGQPNQGALRNPPGGAFRFALALFALALFALAALGGLPTIGEAPPRGLRGGA